MGPSDTNPWPGAKPSEILETLHNKMFVEVSCKRVDGEIIWCNYDLARDLGFSVPDENFLDKKLREELLDACSVRVARSDANATEKVKLFADRYGGFGMGYNFGSARGAFLPYGDLFIKGIGHTPLFNDLPGKTQNSHGNLHMWHALYVAALAEVCHSLFGMEPARTLCVIDQGGETVFPDGRRHERAIEVRAGNQLRPAHVAITKTRDDCPQATNFIAMAKKTGQLVLQDTKNGKPLPDLQKTMLSVISAQARAAAKHARWRLVHGSLTASNTLFDGGAIDLAQARSNPRSAPLEPEYDLKHTVIPRGDYGDRVDGLEDTYHSVRRSLNKEKRDLVKAMPLDIRAEFDKEYLNNIDVEIGVATGLKRNLVRKMLDDGLMEVHELAQVVINLTALKNPESENKVTFYDHNSAVVDVFSLLGELPKVYFKPATSSILSSIRKQLKPHFLGDKEQIAQLKCQFSDLTLEFQERYTQLMNKAELYSDLYWENETEFKKSVAARARFENNPINHLFFDRRFDTFQTAATHFRESKDQLRVQNVIQQTIANSCRNVEAILNSGGREPIENDGIEIQIRRIERLRYSLCVWQQQAYSTIIRIDLCLLKASGNQYRCDYTPAEGGSAKTATGKVISKKLVRFEIPIPEHHRYGVLSGHILTERENKQWCVTGQEIHYVYASPDQMEFKCLKANMRTTSY